MKWLVRQARPEPPRDNRDVLDAQAWMLEQVGSLSVDLERIVVVEQIEIEQPVRRIGRL